MRYKKNRGFVMATAITATLATGTAVLADDDDRDEDMVQVMPFGFGSGGRMNITAMTIDGNDDGIVSSSEASQHASAAFSVFDGDGDGQLTEDEYLDSAPAILSRGRRSVERLFVNRIAAFAAMNADGDETVTLPEFMTKAQKTFEAADINGDGKVTVWEFRAQQNPF